MRLERYWLVFTPNLDLPIGVSYGCGVTAYDYDDAVELLRFRVFGGADMPQPLRTVSHVDISSLDEKHVTPNMSDPLVRGVWFPRGYG